MGSSNSIINIVVKKLINIIGQDRDNDLIWYLNYLLQKEYRETYEDNLLESMTLIQGIIRCPDRIYNGVLLYVLSQFDDDYSAVYDDYMYGLDVELIICLNEYVKRI